MLQIGFDHINNNQAHFPAKLATSANDESLSHYLSFGPETLYSGGVAKVTLTPELPPLAKSPDPAMFLSLSRLPLTG